MAKFEICSLYYDGKSIEEKTLGVIEAQNLGALIAHIKKCGYVGKDGHYERRLNPGWLDYHGDHSHTISFVPYEEPRLFSSEEDWWEIAHPYDESEYEEIEPGYYEYTWYPEGEVDEIFGIKVN